MFRTGLVLAACGLLGACTTIDAGKTAGGASADTTYFGIVRVVMPAAGSGAAPVTALDSTAVGLRFQDGIGVGYFHDSQVAVPADCRVVIFVQNQTQLNQLARQFADFKEGICGTIKAS